MTMFSRKSAFTLIELLVVVAIIALLVSILLPSLGQARSQAKASVCASRLRSFGQALAVYAQTNRSKFTPVNPWIWMPQSPQPGVGGSSLTRQYSSSYDMIEPAVSWLAFYGMDITPEIPPGTQPGEKLWESFPYGFRIQSIYKPDSLWEGFFCPAQNIHNTTDDTSPEINLSGGGGNFASARHQAASTQFKNAGAYMQNHFLRCGMNLGASGRYGGTRPLRPSGPVARDYMKNDNLYPVVFAYLSHEGPEAGYYVQATSPDQLTNAADCVYLADSLDYRTNGSTRADGFSRGSYEGEVSAGMILGMHEQRAVVLGARHLGTANVLYVDGHVTRDGQIARNKRGSMTIASTFADFVPENDMGSQYKLLPTWRYLD